MNPSVKKEIIAIILLVVFMTTFYLSMPPMVYMLGYAAVLAMFVVFTHSIFTKTAQDERETAHQSWAAEAGFAAAGLSLLSAIAYQAIALHYVDPWLFGILFCMLAVRLGVRLYLDNCC